jgi:CcmD family protein
MNGMAQNSWPYVIAAYVVTWVGLGGYAWYLWRVVTETQRNASHSSSR